MRVSNLSSLSFCLPMDSQQLNRENSLFHTWLAECESERGGATAAARRFPDVASASTGVPDVVPSINPALPQTHSKHFSFSSSVSSEFKLKQTLNLSPTESNRSEAFSPYSVSEASSGSGPLAPRFGKDELRIDSGPQEIGSATSANQTDSVSLNPLGRGDLKSRSVGQEKAGEKAGEEEGGELESDEDEDAAIEQAVSKVSWTLNNSVRTGGGGAARASMDGRGRGSMMKRNFSESADLNLLGGTATSGGGPEALNQQQQQQQTGPYYAGGARRATGGAGGLLRQHSIQDSSRRHSLSSNLIARGGSHSFKHTQPSRPVFPEVSRSEAPIGAAPGNAFRGAARRLSLDVHQSSYNPRRSFQVSQGLGAAATLPALSSIAAAGRLPYSSSLSADNLEVSGLESAEPTRSNSFVATGRRRSLGATNWTEAPPLKDCGGGPSEPTRSNSFMASSRPGGPFPPHSISRRLSLDRPSTSTGQIPLGRGGLLSELAAAPSRGLKSVPEAALPRFPDFNGGSGNASTATTPPLTPPQTPDLDALSTMRPQAAEEPKPTTVNANAVGTENADAGTGVDKSGRRDFSFNSPGAAAGMGDSGTELESLPEQEEIYLDHGGSKKRWSLFGSFKGGSKSGKLRSGKDAGSPAGAAGGGAFSSLRRVFKSEGNISGMTGTAGAGMAGSPSPTGSCSSLSSVTSSSEASPALGRSKTLEKGGGGGSGGAKASGSGVMRKSKTVANFRLSKSGKEFIDEIETPKSYKSESPVTSGVGAGSRAGTLPAVSKVATATALTGDKNGGGSTGTEGDEGSVSVLKAGGSTAARTAATQASRRRSFAGLQLPVSPHNSRPTSPFFSFLNRAQKHPSGGSDSSGGSGTLEAESGSSEGSRTANSSGVFDDFHKGKQTVEANTAATFAGNSVDSASGAACESAQGKGGRASVDDKYNALPSELKKLSLEVLQLLSSVMKKQDGYIVEALESHLSGAAGVLNPSGSGMSDHSLGHENRGGVSEIGGSERDAGNESNLNMSVLSLINHLEGSVQAAPTLFRTELASGAEPPRPRHLTNYLHQQRASAGVAATGACSDETPSAGKPAALSSSFPGLHQKRERGNDPWNNARTYTNAIPSVPQPHDVWNAAGPSYSNGYIALRSATELRNNGRKSMTAALSTSGGVAARRGSFSTGPPVRRDLPAWVEEELQEYMQR